MVSFEHYYRTLLRNVEVCTPGLHVRIIHRVCGIGLIFLCWQRSLSFYLGFM